MWLKSIVSALGLASLALGQKSADEEGEVRSISVRRSLCLKMRHN